MVVDRYSERPLLDKESRDSQSEGNHEERDEVNSSGAESSTQRPPSRSVLLLCWIGVLLVFVASLAVLLLAYRFALSARRMCVEELSTASPALEAIQDHWEWRQFNGTVHAGGDFKGPPTKEVLARWAEIGTPVAFSIDHEMLMAVGGRPDSVKIPDNLGGGYMAILEVHHQLHCLGELWKNTWPELYNKDAGVPHSKFRDHLDHCADILRQQLTCNGDVSVIPQNWVLQADYPTPNFNGWRKCRSYEAITAWEQEHMVTAPGGRFEKPADAVELDGFP